MWIMEVLGKNTTISIQDASKYWHKNLIYTFFFHAEQFMFYRSSPSQLWQFDSDSTINELNYPLIHTGTSWANSNPLPPHFLLSHLLRIAFLVVALLYL